MMMFTMLPHCYCYDLDNDEVQSLSYASLYRTFRYALGDAVSREDRLHGGSIGAALKRRSAPDEGAADIPAACALSSSNARSLGFILWWSRMGRL
jgi:hypothetical protein